MNSILNPAYPHIVEKIFTCLNFDLVSISNFRLLNHQLKNTLENVLMKDLARLIFLRKFKELTDCIICECDVCRSPDQQENNKMVFCDKCKICVHQACYGITSIPSGPWFCRTCSLNITPKCELCPSKGGAMKATKTGKLWAHVSCALWIPEVSIGCVEKMEPITKISSIPSSCWNLLCVLCKDRVGSCIQCSVKTCKVAYHVTCAFKLGLEMRAIIEDENAEDGVQLRSYCQNHSLNKKAGNVHLFSEMVLDDSDDDEIEEVVEDEDEN